VYYLRRPFSSATSRSCSVSIAASGVSLRRFAYAARPAGLCRGARSPPACEDADGRMGDRALYRRPRTTSPEPGHKIHRICTRYRDHATEPVWPWTSLYPMAHASSISPSCSTGHTSAFGLAAVDHDGGGLLRRRHWRDALARHGNRQSSHRPGLAVHRCGLTGVLSDTARYQHGWQGAWRDNVFVEGCEERKYEEVYLRPTKTVRGARGSIGRISTSTMAAGPHSALTIAPRIKPTLSSSAPRRPNPAEAPLIDAEILVQTSDRLLIHDPVTLPTFDTPKAARRNTMASSNVGIERWLTIRIMALPKAARALIG